MIGKYNHFFDTVEMLNYINAQGDFTPAAVGPPIAITSTNR